MIQLLASSFQLLEKFVRRIFLATSLLALIFLPSLASAQTASAAFSNQGVFGCNRNTAALSNSVGAFTATGGVYVPVADFTVELNTGTLVYQQCVLRGIVDRESESVNAGQIAKIVNFINVGNGGNAYFMQKPGAERLNFSDKRALATMQDQNLVSAMNPNLGNTVRQTKARSYMQTTRNRQAELNCTDDGSTKSGLAALLPGRDPACYGIGAYNIYSEMVDSDIAQCLEYIDKELEYGHGFYSVVDGDICNGGTIKTPGIYVEEEGVQAITSGFRRVENANDVDQMVGALYAGLGTQALTGSGGLTGLSSSLGSTGSSGGGTGGQSYLSQLSSESIQGLQNAAANAALGILAAARAVEVQYGQAVTNIANLLTSTIAQLRGVENQCWSLIAYNTSALHVCTAAPTGNTCTDAAGNSIKIATSTQFSQPIVDAQIQPLATQIVTGIQNSNTALGLIDSLIAGVSNTSSGTAQQQALVQLDALVSQGKLHTQANVSTVQSQLTTITTSMSQLIDNTKTQWGDSTDVTQGWCNVNNQAVIDFWDQKWKI
jgi:hypothetical protein